MFSCAVDVPAGGESRPRISVGRDPRLSGEELAQVGTEWRKYLHVDDADGVSRWEDSENA